jgi:hypothetical protein
MFRQADWNGGLNNARPQKSSKKVLVTFRKTICSIAEHQLVVGNYCKIHCRLGGTDPPTYERINRRAIRAKRTTGARPVASRTMSGHRAGNPTWP